MSVLVSPIICGLNKMQMARWNARSVGSPGDLFDDTITTESVYVYLERCCCRDDAVCCME
jgi:hypothetical protein